MADAPPAYGEKGNLPYPAAGAGGYPPQQAPYPPPGNNQPYPPQGYPPPPQSGYPPQQVYPPPGQPVTYSVPGVTVVHGQPTAAVVITSPVGCHMGYVPVRTTCTNCRQEIMSSIHYESGTMAWIACGVLLLFGCWLGCCLIPFCIDSCKDAVHTCPNCKQVIGRCNRLS